MHGDHAREPLSAEEMSCYFPGVLMGLCCASCLPVDCRFQQPHLLFNGLVGVHTACGSQVCFACVGSQSSWKRALDSHCWLYADHQLWYLQMTKTLSVLATSLKNMHFVSVYEVYNSSTFINWFPGRRSMYFDHIPSITLDLPLSQPCHTNDRQHIIILFVGLI